MILTKSFGVFLLNNPQLKIKIVFSNAAKNYILSNSKTHGIILWKRSISGCFLAYDELVVSLKEKSMWFNSDELTKIESDGIIVYIHSAAFEFLSKLNRIVIDFKDDEFFPSLEVKDVKPITHETTC